MAIEPFEFSKNWEDKTDFPTVEPREINVRADIQLLYDELAAKLNEVIEALNTSTESSVISPDIKGLSLRNGTLCYSTDGVNWSRSGAKYGETSPNVYETADLVRFEDATVTKDTVGASLRRITIAGLKGPKGDKGDPGFVYTTATCELPASGWEAAVGRPGYVEQYIEIAGLYSDDLIIVGPADYISEYTAAGVFCSEQGDGYVVFLCPGSTAPEVDLTVNLVIFTATAGMINAAEVGA